jgi:hypothetical protein
MLAWFDAREAQEFGKSLAQFFIERVPLDPTKKNSPKKQQETLNKMLTQLSVFKLKAKLNFYKKAKLWNAFKWALYEAGYDREAVDQMVSELIAGF